MRSAVAILLLSLTLWTPGAVLGQEARDAAGPPPAPELTEQAIDSADLAGWRERREALRAAEIRDAADRRTGKRRKAEAEADAPPPLKDEEVVRSEDPDPFLIRAQILLDRAHASPGVIDGRDGDNMRKAVRAFRELRDLPPGDAIDEAFWEALASDAGKPTQLYEITEEDLKGRFVPELSQDYADLAKLKWIGFRDAAEMLAERFHMDERLLRRLNPEIDAPKAGQRVLVAETGAPPDAKVARIEVDREGGELRAYDAEDALVLIFPATVGSEDTPTPSGEMKVNGSFPNPHYIYDPKKNFQQGKNRKKLTLPPGPNGPVGSMWIDLTKPTYGIHGTPEPEKIDKTGSHGCVRLTNWDAETLGAIVEKGKTTVVFR